MSLSIGKHQKVQQGQDNSILQPLLGSYSVSSHAGHGMGSQHHVSLIQSIGLAPMAKVPLAGEGVKIGKGKARLYVAVFLILVFLGACLFSVVAPFFPQRAIEKGMSQTVAGLVIGSMQLIQFFASVLFAFSMFHFGLKFMLVNGILLASVCSVLFGVLDLGPAGTDFTLLCFFTRIVQGFGVSAYYISCFTMSAILFTDNYGLVVGLLETAIALGFLLGPTIGGALFSLGGYVTPFIVLGCILAAFGPVVLFSIPSGIGNDDQRKESPTRVFKVMFKPALVIVLYTMMTTTMSSVFTETTLGVRLAEFGLTDPFLVGLVYLSSSGAYSVAAPIAGKLSDKYDMGWAVMLVGALLGVIGYLIVGPSPMFNGLIPAGIPQLVIGCLFTHSGLGNLKFHSISSFILKYLFILKPNS